MEQAIASASILLQCIKNDGTIGMPSWIVDWNNNKTQIGSEWVVSPNIFSGIKNSDGTLTGIMLARITGHPGIYGYGSGKDVFHINDTEALISGWEMKESGIQNADGTLKILSEGTIISNDGTDSSVTHWSLKADGSAIFANGNVIMSPDGSASFEGTIKAKDGKIGGWNIAETRLYSTGMCLDTKTHSFAVEPSGKAYDSENYIELIKQNGGVAMYYTKSSDYGLVGYTRFSDSCEQTFSIGATNHIAGWNFDSNSIWSGTKKNVSLSYSEDGITIGSNGLRGTTWYIDVNGDVSFASDNIKLSSTESYISGWKLNKDSISSDYAKISNLAASSGIYFSIKNKIIGMTDSNAINEIKTNGGIYLATKSSNSELYAANNNGKQVFYLSASETNKIAGWSFDNDSIYMLEKCNTTYSFSTTKSITIGSNGIRGKLFRFEIDGSGAIANGAVKWDSTGAVVFSDEASLSFVNSMTGTYLSKIDKNGIYTGELSADNITSGTISTATIRQKDGKWELNADGSGVLASGAITWSSGGSITMSSGVIGGVKIDGVTITNEGFNNSACVILRNDINNCFAGIGGNVLPVETGLCAVARFENNNDRYKQESGTNYALVVSAQGARRNAAINISAGYISGLALNTEIISSNKTIGKEINVAVTLSDTSALEITLPTMRQCDDGHVLIVCNQGSYGGNLNAGVNYENDAAEASGITRNSYVASPSDGRVILARITKGITRIRLIYCHYLSCTIVGKTYSGCWMVL